MKTYENTPYGEEKDIREALSAAVSEEFPSALCRQRTLREMQRIREEKMMEKNRKKNIRTWKVAVLVAACAALFGLSALAAGKIAFSEGHGTLLTELTRYEDVGTYEKKTGLSLLAPKAFSNGYGFRSVNYAEGRDVDGEGNTLHEYMTLKAAYEKEGQADIYISVSPAFSEESVGEKAQESRRIGDCEAYYSANEYLFLPPDGTPTEAEIERQESDPHFYISYGSKEREEKHMSSVLFIKDGAVYDIFCTDEAPDADTLFGMAEEMLLR